MLKELYNLVENSNVSRVYQPIPLLIMDINMPFDGLRSVVEIKKLYEKVNSVLSTVWGNRQRIYPAKSAVPSSARDGDEPPPLILRPLICYLSAS